MNMAEVKANPLAIRDFSKVILTLENVLIPDDKLSPTPSMQDGLDLDTETDLRILGCELIQSAGILLKLPQVAMATGQVLYQRFYYSKSLVKHNFEVVAMGCINLASKIEECPRRLRDVINVVHHIKQVRSQKTIHPLILDQNYITTKNQVIKAERRILKELGFCVHVQHPHKVIVMYLQVLEAEKNQRLVQCAWNYMNDSFRTDVFVRFQPETIACACIYLAARQLQIPLPNSPSWFAIFNVDEQNIQEICLTILKLYARPRPNYEKLEAKVNELKKAQMEAKNKAKGLSSDYGTPRDSSRPSSPKNVSPNPALLHALKRIKEEDKHSENGRNNVKTSRSRSRGRSSSSRSNSKSPKRSRRHSRSRSPPSKKHKKDKYISSYDRDRYVSSKDHKHSHKRKKHSRSRSVSLSPSRSPDRYKSSSRKKYYKDKDHYYSPERHSTKRRRNGHSSPGRERYDKYRR
ncbi:cyclin-L1-like [Saccostrea cucullata]|uniref:cyclin-L1-like n=1 Tax=Saccostrea cuccullata TaxID=36930 RepID=UPI002ED58CE6